MTSMPDTPLREEAHNRRRLLMERSRPGRTGVTLPASDVPPQLMPEQAMLRDDLQLPEVTEGEVVRYFHAPQPAELLHRHQLLPPRQLHHEVQPQAERGRRSNTRLRARAPRAARGAGPGMPGGRVHGCRPTCRRSAACPSASLAPLAGAQGELAGILTLRAALDARGDGHRRKMLIPDTAHGTNPASAAMAGFQVISIPSTSGGDIDLDAVRAEANGEDLAGVMFTQPTTLGLFDRNAIEMCRMVHEAGGLVYGDGANMNALLGRAKLGHFGFDVVHMNLHKTFSTPHGGGGPGAGPICVTEALAPFLPGPIVVQRDDGSYGSEMPAQSIGRCGASQGNFGVLIRALTYISLLGGEGMLNISGNAVLNANYLLAKLRPLFELPYDRSVMHEVVFAAASAPERPRSTSPSACWTTASTPPPCTSPLVVPEALMIEPTETESKETLDAFIETLERIDAEAAADEEFLRGAPYETPISRLDEARAARPPRAPLGSAPPLLPLPS